MTTDTRRPTWPELRERELREHPEVYEAYAKFLRDAAAGVPYDDDRPMIEIQSRDEIPDFTSEDEEDEYWGMHEFSDAAWRSLPPPSPQVQSVLDRLRAKVSSRPPAAG